MEQPYPSALLEKAVSEFSLLPGIGRKTALRLVLHLLKMSVDEVETFTQALHRLRTDVKYCRVCHNISDTDVCNLCASPRRDASTVCVVENVQDVMAIENTQQYNGLYHVLGGIISPMEGDTTNFYISRKLSPHGVKLSVIARGISVGDEIEYTDEVTLGRSILNRTAMNE